jgi:hypothetical protein
MITEPRIKRLRELIAEIELLPESPERDRLLSEFRSRAVDLDTGVTPRAVLPLREIPDPTPRRAVAPKVAPPAPPRAIEIARPANDKPFCVEERLSLEDALRDHPVAPWTLGLRG